MVKFESIHSVGIPPAPGSPPKTGGTGNSSAGVPFGDALRAEQARLAREAGAQSAPSHDVRRSAVAGAERLLEAAEAFRHKLSDGRLSLREVEPWVRSLERERDGVVGLARGLPEGDRGRQILLEIAALATAESAKFRRGDYV